MAIRKPVNTRGIYFITFTCHQWLPLIDLTNGYDIVYNWFDVFSERGHVLTGYVIMPNHLHLLLHYTGIGHSLNTVVGNGKRFMGYEIVKRLEEQDQKGILAKLEEAVEFTDRNRGKKHELWEDSFDVKECRTEKFILQKLNYIHNNPCKGRWMLADSPVHYWHSSASFYFNGKTSGYPVKDYRELMSINQYGK